MHSLQSHLAPMGAGSVAAAGTSAKHSASAKRLIQWRRVAGDEAEAE